MKRLSTIINFLLLTLLVWVCINYAKHSVLLTEFNPFFDLVTHLAKAFVYPQLILSANENYADHTYISLVYFLVFLLYLNVFGLYVIKSRLELNKHIEISKSHELASFIWEMVYSKSYPPIYFRPNKSGYEQRKVESSAIETFIEEVIKLDQTKVYFLVIFTVGFVLTPFFCFESLDASPHRILNFWNAALIMVYVQFKFIFEMIFVGMNWLYGNSLNTKNL